LILAAAPFVLCRTGYCLYDKYIIIINICKSYDAKAQYRCCIDAISGKSLYGPGSMVSREGIVPPSIRSDEMSEVIDKIVQAQQAEMDEEVANDQVRRLTGQILEDLVGPIHLASKVVLQKLGSTARWLDHAVDTELERRVEIRSDYLEKDEDEEPDGFLSAIRAEMTRRGKATELRNGQLWTKQDGPQLDRLEDMCDVHRQGEVLWDIAERLTGLGLEVGLL